MKKSFEEVRQTINEMLTMKRRDPMSISKLRAKKMDEIAVLAECGKSWFKEDVYFESYEKLKHDKTFSRTKIKSLHAIYGVLAGDRFYKKGFAMNYINKSDLLRKNRVPENVIAHFEENVLKDQNTIYRHDFYFDSLYKAVQSKSKEEFLRYSVYNYNDVIELFWDRKNKFLKDVLYDASIRELGYMFKYLNEEKYLSAIDLYEDEKMKETIIRLTRVNENILDKDQKANPFAVYDYVLRGFDERSKDNAEVKIDIAEYATPNTSIVGDFVEEMSGYEEKDISYIGKKIGESVKEKNMQL